MEPRMEIPEEDDESSVEKESSQAGYYWENPYASESAGELLAGKSPSYVMIGAGGASISELSSDLPFPVNQSLIDSARKINDERDQIRIRVEKMERHRDQVTEAVYRKVKNDYLLHYRALTDQYQQKKHEIDAELEKLYEATRELSHILDKRREELEEAKFRHFLGEFSDQKYKAVENKEEKEIAKSESLLVKLQNQIEQYESLIISDDTAFLEALGILEKPKKSPASPSEVILKDALPKKAKPVAKANKVSDETLVGLTIPTEPKRAAAERPAESEHSFSLFGSLSSDASKKSNSTWRQPAKESSVYTQTSIKEDDDELPSQEAALFVPQEEESIADILNSIPLESSQPGVRKSKSVVAPAPKKIEVEPSLSEAKVVVLETGGETINFAEINLKPLMTIGRLPTSDIVLPSTKVSRHHAEIELRDDDYVVIDLDSSNGVYVNNKRVKESLLRDGDVIGIGRYKLQFEAAK